jgi:hypothetical protein
MESNQSSRQKPKGHLRYESLLKALPPDILQELVRRRLEDVEKAMRENPSNIVYDENQNSRHEEGL